MANNTSNHHATTINAYTAFPNAPDDALVRAHVVAMLLGCHVNTVWRMAREGRLPPPNKVSSGISGWRAGDVRARLRGEAA